MSTKQELEEQNRLLKIELDQANEKIRDYEEIITRDNVKDLGYSNLTKDDIFNITHNSTYIIDTS